MAGCSARGLGGCDGWLLCVGDGRFDVCDGGILDDPVGYGRLAAIGKKGI